MAFTIRYYFFQIPTGFWTEMFLWSKAVELIDTAFLVLRKRPIIFLHWYHHVTVMMYTWHACKEHAASGRWFISMNYTVHALMYTYYASRYIYYCKILFKRHAQAYAFKNSSRSRTFA